MAGDSSSTRQHRLWPALLLAAVIALALTTWHARHLSAEIEAQTHEHASALTRQFAALLAPELQRGDRSRLQSTAQAVTSHYAIVREVVITDTEARQLARAGEQLPDSTSRSDEWRLGHPIVPGSGLKPLGRLSVRVDRSAVRSRQAGARWQSVGIAALMVLGVVGAVSLLRGGSSGPALALRRHGARWQPLRSRLPTLARLRARDLASAVDRLQDDNKRLEAARREAEAASERKSRHLADIGHEIRTPMNAILGFTELMATDDWRARQSDHIATIRDSVRGLLGLLNGMLDLSKAEAGKLELDHSDVDVNALIEDVFRLFAPQTYAKGIELMALPAPTENGHVRADALRLKQILVNLVSNAMRFTDRGYIRLAAQVLGETDTHVRMRFAVDDTGCGIPHVDQPNLFEAFLQGAHAVEDGRVPGQHTGTGLGLNIASELARLMGGRIEFESREEQGSSFWLTLDLAHSNQLAALTAPAVRRRIALIDPNPVTRESYVRRMAHGGIDADPMDEAQWAALTAPDCYDAIVVHVPACETGSGRIAPSNSRLRIPGIPLIAFAYEHDSGVRARLWGAGYRRVIDKLTAPSALLEALEVALVAETATPARDGSEQARGKPRVLVVDDHPVNLRLVREYLSSAGLSAETAATSDEALHQARHTPFDAILLDLRLPDRDGYATVRRLRNDAGPNARTHVIAATADCPAAQAEAALTAGFDDVLGKPISQAALLEALRTSIPMPDEPGGDTPVSDHALALSRARNQPDLADELFAALCRTLPASGHGLALARIRGDVDALRAEAHRLRGAVIYCGVPRLERAVGELDRALHDREELALTRTVYALEREIAAVLAHAEPEPNADRASRPPSGTDTKADAR